MLAQPAAATPAATASPAASQSVTREQVLTKIDKAVMFWEGNVGTLLSAGDVAFNIYLGFTSPATLN